MGFLEKIWEKVWGGQEIGSATGIAVKLEESYYILTDAHVIAEGNVGQLYYVEFNGIKELIIAKKYSWDHLFDLGLLEFEDKTFVPPGIAILGDSSTATVQGEETFCKLGNPLGLKNYWNCGKVSKEKAHTPRSKAIGISIDVTCNPGDSGSPFIGLNRGEVIGLGEAISASPHPICFITPINTFKKLLPKLLKPGGIKHGALGMAIANTYKLTESELETTELYGKEKGILVAGINPDSAAERAGIKVGDKLISIANESGTFYMIVDDMPEFLEKLNLNFFLDDKVIITLKRNDIFARVEALMDKQPAETQVIITPKTLEVRPL